MAYLPTQPRSPSGKLIHSNFCFLAVPAGLCVVAVMVRWFMAFT